MKIKLSREQWIIVIDYLETVRGYCDKTDCDLEDIVYEIVTQVGEPKEVSNE